MVKFGRLKHAVFVNAWGVKIELPAGTRVQSVLGRNSFCYWGVLDKELIKRLSGNTHDPNYRWLFVDDEHIEKEA